MKNVITSYTFDASAKTIDFSGYAGFTPERLVAIFNATDNTLIYGQEEWESPSFAWLHEQYPAESALFELIEYNPKPIQRAFI